MIMFLTYLADVVDSIHLVCAFTLLLPFVLLAWGSFSDTSPEVFVRKNKQVIVYVLLIMVIATIINVLTPSKAGVLELLSIYKRD